MTEENEDNKSTKELDILTKFSHFCDENLRLIKNLPYVIALAGVVIIGRRIHVTSKFSGSQAIPQSFIDGNVKLRGQIKTCFPNGDIEVDHIPILSLNNPFKSNKKGNQAPGVKLRLVGIEHTESSLKYIEANLQNKHIWFRIFKKDPQLDFLDGFVYHKLGRWKWHTEVNQLLIRHGLARVHFETRLNEHKQYKTIIDKYIAFEAKAEKKGKGMWQKPPISHRVKQCIFSAPSRIYSWFKHKIKR